MSTQKKLIEAYQKAQKKLVEIIQRKQTYGSATAYERSLLRQIQKELKKLKKSSKALVEQLVKENYKTGLQGLIDDLLQDDTAPRLFNMFNGLNTSQIELITQNANIDLNKAINIVGRRVQDAVREAGVEATAEKLTTGQTVREMQKKLQKKLKQQNLTAIEYANGTKMPIEKYAETVARSTTAETQNKAKVIQGQDWGYELVRFTEHSPTCEVCSMYQGRVYALTKEAANGKYKGSKGQALHFPYLYDTALPHGYSTIHPNCRHRLSVLPARAYTASEMEEFSRKSMQPFEDMRSDQERKAYAKEQEVKRKRNESRKQYEKIKAVLPNEAPKTFAGFVKMKAAKSERYQELLQDYKAVIGIAKQQESGIIKNIDVDDVEILGSTKGISSDVLTPILSIVSKFGNDYYYNEVSFESLGSGHRVPLMQTEPYPMGKMVGTRLIINQDVLAGCTLEEINDRILNSSTTVARNLTEAAIHETGHAKMYYQKSMSTIEKENDELLKIHIKGINETAYSDGSECIAETEVLLSRGDPVPEEAKALYNKYLKKE